MAGAHFGGKRNNSCRTAMRQMQKTSPTFFCSAHLLFIWAFNSESVRWSSGQLDKEVSSACFHLLPSRSRTLDIVRQDIPTKKPPALLTGSLKQWC
ncbi:hypothetical protein AVEN_25204-1 [Araneus ventricosus]|uniref:Uncharacterized protein n=1 Tax=Araneus ventricosus TaxID=182803 RepID=A0A4Y2UZT3_ARAVE|nr:hypothetical protein AVEN_25204-1 [Araneus ventricosus]